MHLGLVVCVSAGILRLARFPKGHAGPDAADPWSATSAATVLLAATLLVPSSAWAQAPTPLSDDAIRRLLSGRVDTYGHSVGVVVGIVEPTGRRVIAHGTRSKSNATPVDGDAVFELASATKAFTSFAAGRRGDAAALLLRANGVTQRAPRIDGTLVVLREIAVDPGILERYVGRYEFVPGVVLSISRKDARLFAQLTGQPGIEIFASSERQFFYKVVNAELTFEVNDAGRVTAVVLRQNGVEQRARRSD
jgi:hypothetical protein